MNKKYNLNECKKILRHSLKWYRKKNKNLTEDIQKKIQNNLYSLQEAIEKKDREAAEKLTNQLIIFSKKYLKKKSLEKFIDTFIAIAVALAIAIVFRQTCFENYTVPSGSMRPILKEKDFLVVSKTAFSINTPTRKGQFYFDKKLLKRGDIVIFTTADMNIENSDHMYFFIFPGKKQFIKRLIAKPGDILYFYGGNIYGIDKNKNEITEFRNQKWFTQLEHIPFITFEGHQSFQVKESYNIFNTIILSQMNIPLVKFMFSPNKNFASLLIPPYDNNSSLYDYYDIWGFKNYATARIITNKEAQKFNLLTSTFSKNAPYYLELTHHPSIKKLYLDKTYSHQSYSTSSIPSLSYTFSLLPLNDKHLKTIFNNLYTCRFKVKNGLAMKSGYKTNNIHNSFSPKLPDVPNGCYEFQNGIAYSVNFTGIIKKLPKSHPIYKFSPQKAKLFYNLGIEMNTFFSPKQLHQKAVPHRYAYLRNGSLYLMGHSIFEKNDLTLKQFLSSEKSNKIHPFIDNKPPILPNGSLDKKFIEKFGLHIPEGHYLALGDNHAMSGDCREFGFVPEANLRGRASCIYWPPQERFGKLFQPSHKWITFPKIVVFSFFIILSLLFYLYNKRKNKIPISWAPKNQISKPKK